MKFEFIKETFIPETPARRGFYAGIIIDWLKTENKTVKFSCASKIERKKIYSAVASYRKIHNLDFTIYLENGTYNIYLVKA